jgi:hypothetical protein
VEGRCERHLFDVAVDLCGRCGSEFCADCLVYSFGPKKPPFCLPCAVSAAGVRLGSGGRKSEKRKEMKQFQRRREDFLAQTEVRNNGPKPPVTLDDSWLDRLEQPSTRPIPGHAEPSLPHLPNIAPA